MTPIAKGDWVEISRQLLAPEERASNLPQDTAIEPYRMKVRGTALESGALGEKISVQTTGGRHLTGVATAVNPCYHHNFGESVPELIRIRAQIRNLMKGEAQ